MEAGKKKHDWIRLYANESIISNLKKKKCQILI